MDKFEFITVARTVIDSLTRGWASDEVMYEIDWFARAVGVQEPPHDPAHPNRWRSRKASFSGELVKNLGGPTKVTVVRPKTTDGRDMGFFRLLAPPEYIPSFQKKLEAYEEQQRRQAEARPPKPAFSPQQPLRTIRLADDQLAQLGKIIANELRGKDGDAA